MYTTECCVGWGFLCFVAVSMLLSLILLVAFFKQNASRKNHVSVCDINGVAAAAPPEILFSFQFVGFFFLFFFFTNMSCTMHHLSELLSLHKIQNHSMQIVILFICFFAFVRLFRFGCNSENDNNEHEERKWKTESIGRALILIGKLTKK